MATSYEQFFRDADVDGTGFLTLSELTAVLENRGYKDADGKIHVSIFISYLGLLILCLMLSPTEGAARTWVFFMVTTVRTYF